MIGAEAHSRRRCVTTRPSMSGSPKSSRIRSGLYDAAWVRPSAPFTASTRRYPWLVKEARRNFLICVSSSTTKSNGGTSVTIQFYSATSRWHSHFLDGVWGFGRKWRAIDWQVDVKLGTAPRPVHDEDLPTVRPDDAFADRQTKPHSPAPSAANAIEFVENSLLFARWDAWPTIGHDHFNATSVHAGADLERA